LLALSLGFLVLTTIMLRDAVHNEPRDKHVAPDPPTTSAPALLPQFSSAFLRRRDGGTVIFLTNSQPEERVAQDVASSLGNERVPLTFATLPASHALRRKWGPVLSNGVVQRWDDVWILFLRKSLKVAVLQRPTVDLRAESKEWLVKLMNGEVQFSSPVEDLPLE
jgi:hypothetical protein